MKDFKNIGAPITLHEIEEDMRKRVSVVKHELKNGFEFIKNKPKSVSFFGSARVSEGDVHYEKARNLAGMLAKEGYAVVTGGGPGIMEAANRGAFEAKGISIGLNIKLPHEQSVNPYTTESMSFYYFFIRKVMLSFAAEAYVFFPGGFGTMDEFFEILTLVQTHKIEKIPIFLVGVDYWGKFDAVIKEEMQKNHKTISDSDTSLYTITDDSSLIVEAIKKVPVRTSVRFTYDKLHTDPS